MRYSEWNFIIAMRSMVAPVVKTGLDSEPLDHDLKSILDARHGDRIFRGFGNCHYMNSHLFEPKRNKSRNRVERKPLQYFDGNVQTKFCWCHCMPLFGWALHCMQLCWRTTRTKTGSTCGHASVVSTLFEISCSGTILTNLSYSSSVVHPAK